MLTSFELGPLDTTQVGELARRMRGRETPQDQAAALHRATGGNPLFVFETVRDERSGSRTGPAAASGATTPSRVQAVIERRPGQLSPDARAIAALAGMIGREFTHELRRASDWDEARLVEVLDELWRRRIVREHATAAYDFVHDRIREVAAAEDAVGDRMLQVEGHYLLGVTAFWWADFAAERSLLEQAIERDDPATATTQVRLYGQDPKVVCLIRLAYTMWHLGEPDRARARRDRALALAEDLDDPMTTGYALNYACWVANELGDADELDT